MTGVLETYLRRALISEGLEVHTLEIERYSPEFFGNLIANADTNCGKLRIVYDRSFFVELSPNWTGPSAGVMVAAMGREKRRPPT